MTIAEKQEQLTALLKTLKTGQDRFAFVVGRGRTAPPLEPAFKTDAYRVEGCMAKVWFVPEFVSGRCQFRADSDSAIVKGIAALLCEIYSGQPPADIVRSSPAFLEQWGITQHLTPNRRNSLAKVWQKIHDFAQSHQTQPVQLYDAHNHLQDARLKPHLPAIMSAVQGEPITRMVVNGACEEDWPDVLELARRYPQVLPSFGYHPWYVKERTPRWQSELERFLDAVPSAVGEIGLDKWIEGYDFASQEETFVWQLKLAAQRNLPASIHCLKTWGPLLEILRREPRPACGFLLHSYGGAAELIPELARLGGYFSLPGYFAHERKARQRETFRHVPIDRLLIETDAPDQLLPDARNRFSMLDADGKPINHPANLRAVYDFAAELLGLSLEKLAAQVEANFSRLFLRQ